VPSTQAADRSPRPLTPDRPIEVPISVILVIGVSLYRDGLERALEHAPKITLAGSTSDLVQARIAIRTLQPDIVLLDPGTDPDFTLPAAMAELSPHTRIVALGVREVEADVLRCAQAGMAAYLPRDASVADLIAVIGGAARGELNCPPRIAASLFRRIALMGNATTSGLTPRESEIVQLIDDGLSNKQIARRLRIQVSTVKGHVHNLLRKLNVTRRGVAAARARRRLERSEPD
jgi:DNA-binding NarL/FixJ family response regulator